MKFQGLAIILLILTGMLLETWKIGKQPAEKWDEARRGINAVSMMENRDYFHYYYLDRPDTFNTKPPLTVWLIILSFKSFGISNFALRFHSIVSIFFFFLFISKLILLYRNKTFLILFLGIIITVKGIIGFHVGRTGDTDSLLLLFLTAFLYYFLKYWDFGKKKAIYLSVTFLGLAFYTKSVAILLMLPAVFAYAIFRWDSQKIMKREFWISAGIFILIIISVGIIPAFWNGGNKNQPGLLTNIFSTDMFLRFTDNSFEPGYDPFHVIHVLDMNFSIWNYIFYLAGIFAIYRIFKNGHFPPLQENRLLLLSLLIVLSYGILLTVSMNKHRWYIAPAIPFFAILTVEFIIQFKNRKWMYPVFSAIVIIMSIQKFLHYNDPEANIREFFDKHRNEICEADKLYVDHAVPQDLAWEYIKFNHRSAKSIAKLPSEDSSYMYFGPSVENVPGKVAGYLEGYKLVVKNNRH